MESLGTTMPVLPSGTHQLLVWTSPPIVNACAISRHSFPNFCAQQSLTCFSAFGCTHEFALHCPFKPAGFSPPLFATRHSLFAIRLTFAKIGAVMEMARTAEVERKTAETQVRVKVNLDGTGNVQVDTGIGFFDHMLNTLLRHAWFDATVWARGDTHIDDHHTVEDTGIVLGQAIDKALGERKGVQRFGSAIVPMDEALVLCSVDLSGRGNAFVELPVEGKVGNFDAELAPEFFRALATNAPHNFAHQTPFRREQAPHH